MEWVAQVIAAIRTLAAVASVWFSRSLANGQVKQSREKILAQWGMLREGPLLGHRAQVLIELYDSMSKLHARTQVASIWKPVDAPRTAKLGRKAFDDQRSMEFLSFVSIMVAATPYLPNEVAEAVKPAFALIARDLKVFGGIQLNPGDPPRHQTDNDRILHGICTLAQLLNPPPPMAAPSA